MNNNKLIVATAGAGKTTLLIKKAYEKFPNTVLILTYTEENEEEIRTKIIKLHKVVPPNITIQTWFSFLIKHGVKPFQGSMIDELHNCNVSGLLLVNQRSGIKQIGEKFNIYYREETEFLKHYFTSNMKIYSDKLSKFVVKCDIM